MKWYLRGAMPSKRICLPAGAYGREKSASECSVSLDGVASRISKASWYSPSAPSIGENVSDLTLHKSLQRRQNWDDIENAELSIICERVNIVFQRPGPDEDAFGYHIGCFAYGDSAGTAWPVSLERVPSHENQNIWTLSFNTKAREPVSLAIISWDDIVGRPFEWRSPSWLRRRCPDAGGEFHTAVRADVTTAVDMPVRKLAAAAAYWHFDVCQLVAIAKCLRIQVPDKGTLFSVCFAMAMQEMKLSEEDATELL